MLKVKLTWLVSLMLLTANSAYAFPRLCGPGGHCCFKPVKITCTFMAKPADDVNASKLRLTNKVTFDKCEEALTSTRIRAEDKQFIKTTELCQPKQGESSPSKK
jgi:hypothetical protein